MTHLQYAHIVFYHIPKRAGATAKKALAPFFPDEAQFRVGFTERDTGSVDDYTAFTEAERRKDAFVHGHMTNRLLDHAPRDSFVFTFFRNPSDRVTSLYNYYRKSEGHQFNRIIMEQGTDLKAFITSGGCIHTDNGMTRALAARMDVPYGQCDHGMLSLAVRNRESTFSCIGLSELLAKGMSHLFKLLGADFQAYEDHNVTSRPVFG